MTRSYQIRGDTLTKFLKGEHVMRHQSGLWNGIWTDMAIETTFMRYGKGSRSSGGLVGVTVKPETAKKIILSRHTFARVKQGLKEMRKPSRNYQHVHKEEMMSRIRSDMDDRVAIEKVLKTCIDPLYPLEQISANIVKIFSG